MARPDQQPVSQPEEPQAQAQAQAQAQTPNNDQHSETSQTQFQIHSQSQPSQASETPISQVQGSAIVSLTLRLTTWICLLVSLIVLASDTATVRGVYRDVKIRFSDIYSYRYMMSVVVIGFAYACLLLPFEIYHVSTGKKVSAQEGLSKYIFFGDKVLLSLLATGVGAAFGATFDLKKNLDDLDDFLELDGDLLLSQLRSKLDNFFNMANVSAGFLLLALLSSAASSTLSSMNLQKK